MPLRHHSSSHAPLHRATASRALAEARRRRPVVEDLSNHPVPEHTGRLCQRAEPASMIIPQITAASALQQWRERCAPSQHRTNQATIPSTSRRRQPAGVQSHPSITVPCVSAIQDTAARSAAGLPQGSGGVSVCPAGTHLSSICGPHAFSVGTQHARNSQPRQAIRSHTARGDDQRPCLPQGTGGVVSPPDRHAAGTSRAPHAEVTRASWPPPSVWRRQPREEPTDAAVGRRCWVGNG